MISFEEDRKDERYSFASQVEATLGRAPIVLCNIAGSGVHARHTTALRPGIEASLRLEVADAGVSLVTPAFVVWSRFERPGEPRPFHSGLLVPDPGGELRSAVQRMRKAGLLVPDDSPEITTPTKSPAAPLERPAQSATQQTIPVLLPAGVVALVKEARRRLHASPREMARWAERARTSLGDDAEPTPEREDVLAVWQYLERAIELRTIARLLDE